MKVIFAVALFTGMLEASYAQGITITPAAGFDVTWDGNDGDYFDQNPPPGGANVPENLALASNGGVAFASSASLHFPPHEVANLNDGFYGNTDSHINGQGPSPGHMGVALSGALELTAIAWGRDNGNGQFDDSFAGTDCCGGQVDDRSVGTYELQITTVLSPDETTPDGDWTTIATLNYQSTVDTTPGGGFTPWFRHEYAVSTAGGNPISASGVRIIVPDLGICIDEIEVYSEDSPPPVLSPVEEGGVVEVGNLAAGGTAFAKDVLAGRTIASLNDETFGDASAWAGATADSFAGINLGGTAVEVRSIAFGRDNTGTETDRWIGDYTLQFTDVPNPDETTADGDWTTIGTISYAADNPTNGRLRHRFNFGSKMATGIRLLTPDGAAIDELEIYEIHYVPPPPPALTITPAAGFTATWDGNDGDHFDENPPPGGALVPDNLALATNGGTPFASSPVSFHFPPHEVANLNDGFYGNANSHLNGQGPSPSHMGIALPGPTALTGIAWGRDNGNGAIDDSAPGTDCCGGQVDDRSIGRYTLQFTTVADPDETTADNDWTSIADFTYTGGNGTDNELGGLFTEWLRHEFEIGTDGGGPVMATGVRIIVPNQGICIDEIELYGVVAPPVGPTLDISHDAASGELTIRWNSQDGRLYNLRSEADLSAGEPITWPIFDGNQDLVATPPENSLTFPLPPETARFFVVEEFPAPPEVEFTDDFESGQGQWTTGSDGRPGTTWELGAPSNVGPTAANSGANCFGTNIAADYAIDANVWLRSPPIDLTNAAGATLCFHQFREIDGFPTANPPPAFFDYGTVSVLDAADDSVLAVIETDISDSRFDWEKVTNAMPAEALGKTVKLEFRFRCDDVDERSGWYIDDVLVTVP